MNLRWSTILGRDLRQDEPSEVGVSTLHQAYAAMDRGDLAEAKRIVEYARLEWQVVHDMYVNWSWSFFTYIANTYGEEELEKAMRAVLGSYYKARYDKVMASDVKTQLQLTVEGLRGHLMGRDRQGEIEVTEEADRYVLRLDPCGSGGVARQRVESGLEQRPDLFGFSRKAGPLTWGKERVCYYCAHCSMVNEVLAIENYGHPMRITEYPEKAEDACVWYIYKDPAKIPAEYYERVGKQAPAGAPRLTEDKR
ncbi:MAG: hypothetical protein HBSIN02_05160 [Bacteroidia bacterium]|nr:MAG: hypothetical protein HBSIN02_05160 [Bacteroidia bacterium]